MMAANWIKCSDRMPEDGRDVLVWDINREVSKRYYTEGAYFASFHGHWKTLDEVTHWMPLPEAPEN
jgi:hypothetical protein